MLSFVYLLPDHELLECMIVLTESIRAVVI